MFPCFHFLKLNKITFLLLANPWQVRRRGERDRLRLLDRAIARRDPPPDGAQVHIPEHVELLLQPVPGPGSGVPPDVGVVGGRVAQRPVGVEVRHGRLQQEDQQRPVAVVHRLPDARSQRAHLHGQPLQHGLIGGVQPAMLPAYADTDTDTRYGDTSIRHFFKNKDTGIRQYI